MLRLFRRFAACRYAQQTVRNFQPSTDDVVEAQRELDSFLGSEFAPAEQTPFDGQRSATGGEPLTGTAEAGSATKSADVAESTLTHVDVHGKASMVDVGQVRTAGCMCLTIV